MPKMLDFEAVVLKFGDRAVEEYCRWTEREDDKGLASLASSDVEGIVNWLHFYRVLMGLTIKERHDISKCIVKWAQVRDAERDLSSAQLLDDAHKEMTKACVEGLARKRNVTSLVSKALWLCYPQQVPIFDSFAHRALGVLSNLEEDIEPVPEGLSQYGQFAHAWKHFYYTYADSIKEIDMKSCRYSVRVFDSILLCVGN